jgi:hypothetical protein
LYRTCYRAIERAASFELFNPNEKLYWNEVIIIKAFFPEQQVFTKPTHHKPSSPVYSFKQNGGNFILLVYAVVL